MTPTWDDWKTISSQWFLKHNLEPWVIDVSQGILNGFCQTKLHDVLFTHIHPVYSYTPPINPLGSEQNGVVGTPSPLLLGMASIGIVRSQSFITPGVLQKTQNAATSQR